MPHGGYHGNIVGLGSKPTKPTTGTTYGPAGMGSPPPQPKKPKQNAKSLMTSDDAYSTGTDTNKKKSTTALTFDDNTGREKGLQSNISSKELGRKRRQRVLEIIGGGDAVVQGGNRITIGDDKTRLETIKNENLEGALNALMRKIPEKKFNIKDDSITRYAMKSLGLPINYNQFLYDAFIGTPVFGDDKRVRKSTYKPLTVNDFTNLELLSLKQQALNAIKRKAKKDGGVSINEGVTFRVGGTEELYQTLGSATASINEKGEIILKDFYDFDAVEGPAKNYFIGIEDGEPVIAKSYSQAISHILVNESEKFLNKEAVTGSVDLNKVGETLSPTIPGNNLQTQIRRAIAVLDTTDATQYPKYISDKEKLEKETGQKLLMNLNLGKVN